jgi:hypothetical protein
VLAPALVAGGVELQVPPLRFAPVGMTKGGVACQWAFASGVQSYASARCQSWLTVLKSIPSGGMTIHFLGDVAVFTVSAGSKHG